MFKKPGMGWLYVLIALCVMFSGVMLWGLLSKLDKQKESADAYAALGREALVTGATLFADETETPAVTAAAQPLEGEAEDQNDTVFAINNNVLTLTATPAQAATAVPTAGTTPKPTLAPTASATPKPTPAPTATRAAVTPAQTATASALSGTPTPRPSQGSGWAVLTPTPAPSVSGSAASRPSQGSGWAVLTLTPAGASAVTATEASAVADASAPRATSAPGLTLLSPAPAAAGSDPSAAPSGDAGSGTVGAQPSAPTLAPIASPNGASAPAAASLTQTQEPGRNRVVTMADVRYSVDFGYLQSINPDVKAWLVQDGTIINYPVLQSKDNNQYLDRMFNGKLNKDGSIFLDSGNSAYFNDANSYIYGHHTKTDAMFSTLANYKQQAYYAQHPQLILLTPYGDYCIDLFAARVAAVDDETSWRVKQFTRKADFDAYMAELEARSLFVPDPASTPEWGDQLLALVTCTNDQHLERYVVYGRMRQIVYASQNSVTVTKMAMDNAPTIGGWRDVPGRGTMMTYAQNDPLWADMKYENRTSNRKRAFGQGGCGPTSAAMAIVNLVPEARLGDIFGYAKSSAGYTFCSCSVNQYFCNKLHAQYQIQQPQEYLRYYPLVMASFATGNNMWGDITRTTNPGTNLSFLKKVAWLYKLDLSVTTDTDTALAAVKSGSLAIASLSNSNPLTGGGHYVVIASVDEHNLYVLDPYRKQSYEATDKKNIITQLSPGVLAIKLENARDVGMSTFYVLTKTPATDTDALPVVTE